MCGIVAYFGSAPDSIARMITGMSAIIYRAPDSTGMGMFGNISNSIIQRKNLGSVAGMFEVLLKTPFNENYNREILNLWQTSTMTRAGMQKKLIEHEGLSTDIFNKCLSGDLAYPLIEEIVSGSSGGFVSVFPGYPGRPDPLPGFKISSRNDLRSVVRIMAYKYNLSFVAIKSIFRKLLKDEIKSHGDAFFIKADAADVFNVFDYLFQKIFEEFRPQQTVRHSYKRVVLNPHAIKYFWQLIKKMEVIIPDDFDTDGISSLFRLLDAALVARIPHDSSLEPQLQDILDNSITNNNFYFSWKTLYLTEKGLNVYGMAAAAVLDWLQRNEGLRELSSSIYAGASSAIVSPFGMTGTRCLDYIMQPVVAQGRWALQSSVILKNAHPFMDEKGKRTIVLNGQFSSEIEEDMAEFLTNVADFSFRSDNSSEYFALLWGYYFKILKQEKARFQEVKDQIEKGLEEYAVGSNSINYQIFRQVQNKSDKELDEIAFIEAAKRFTKNGGQIASAGISIKSPRTLYAVSCNRPLFIVRRKSTSDFMVVSDINAAMGLFHQSLIIDVTKEYEDLVKEKDDIISGLKNTKSLQQDMQRVQKEYSGKIDKILSKFAVEVYALEGEDIFAKIFTCFKNGSLMRDIIITDFNGRQLHNIEPQSINLTPTHVHKDLDKSFFETHLEEVPDLLEKMISARISNDGSLNPFPVNIRLLQRKFGKTLNNLQRIFLLGMGSSNHVSLFAAGFAKTLLPEIQVICLEPVQVDMLSRLIDPERDLVLLVSWSSTTAEMVKIAKFLFSMNVLFAGVTEKTFGDMALIAQKSCGIIPVMSGEEVTVPAVKSTFCSFMAVNFFILWLCSDIMEQQVDYTVSGSIKQIPGAVKQVLSNADIMKMAEKLSFSHVNADVFIVIDALHTRGTGYEAVMKMEEMTWSVKGRAVDYRDIEISLFNSHKDKNFVVVNATDRERMMEAVDIMELLNEAEIPFFVVTFENSRMEKIEKLSRGNFLLLPKCEDFFQPFVDLVFYYMLSFYSAKARGRKADDYPRNRAKSVTTSRSTAMPEFSPAGELFNIRDREKMLPDNLITDTDFNSSLLWEENSRFSVRARQYFHLMKKFAHIMLKQNSFRLLVDYEETMLEKFSLSLFNPQKDMELLFLSMDITANAAVRNIVAKLHRLLPCRMRVLQHCESLDSVKKDSIIIAVSSSNKKNDIFDKLKNLKNIDILWFGQDSFFDETDQDFFSMGKYFVNNEFEEADSSLLYAGLSLMLIKAWSLSEPEKGADLEKHFKRSGHVVLSILNDADLARDTIRVMDTNHEYRTVLYLSPPDGTGLCFTRHFDTAGKIVSKTLPFGAGAHGSLVTVDNRVDIKFVRLEKREIMVKRYGDNKIRVWEKIYLKGEDIDSYLETPTNDLSSRVESPFFAEGAWYLPVLRPEYPASEDNLIVVDAGSERYFDQAADDLAVFGCRHARMIVITQQAFMGMPERRSLQKFPLTGLLKIPAFKGNDQPIPLSDMHIPFAVNLVGAAMAGVAPELQL